MLSQYPLDFPVVLTESDCTWSVLSDYEGNLDPRPYERDPRPVNCVYLDIGEDDPSEGLSNPCDCGRDSRTNCNGECEIE